MTIGFVLVSLAGALVALEIALRPEIFDRVSPPADQAQIVTGNSQMPQPPATGSKAPATTTPLAADFFRIEDLKNAGVEISEGKYSMVVFRHAQVIPAQDPFFLVSFTATLNGKPFAIISEILPTEEMSAGRLMSLVRRKLRSVIPNEDLGLITLSDSLSTRGEANFYLNDKKSYPDQVFLVTRAGTKVLAMQFSSEYNTQVAELLPLFFKE